MGRPVLSKATLAEARTRSVTSQLVSNGSLDDSLAPPQAKAALPGGKSTD